VLTCRRLLVPAIVLISACLNAGEVGSSDKPDKPIRAGNNSQRIDKGLVASPSPGSPGEPKEPEPEPRAKSLKPKTESLKSEV
jgi:hypothetical protein